MRVVFVTDPMCSWCFGMTPEIEALMAAAATDYEFDFALGGINVDSTKPVGAYARHRLARLWADVTATTGQTFAGSPAANVVYNSRLPCLAVQAVRQRRGTPPFGYLHDLQQRFFQLAQNINDRELLRRVAQDHGVAAGDFDAALDDPAVRLAVEEEFASCRGYGTNALPSVLLSHAGDTVLVAGGYVSAEQLRQDLEHAARRLA